MAERALDCRLLRAFAEKDRGGAVAAKVLSLLWNVAANESHHVNVCNQAVAASAQLLADQQYVMEPSKMCHDQAVTWDQRSQLRANELSALTSAIHIVGPDIADATTGGARRDWCRRRRT